MRPAGFGRFELLEAGVGLAGLREETVGVVEPREFAEAALRVRPAARAGVGRHHPLPQQGGCGAEIGQGWQQRDDARLDLARAPPPAAGDQEGAPIKPPAKRKIFCFTASAPAARA